MNMFFNHTWDEALVAEVIDRTRRMCPSALLGRTTIQKIVYFLHVLHVPMSFKFRIHHYGPYCDGVVSSLEWLQADDIVVDRSNAERYSNFSTDEEVFQELKSKYSDAIKAYQETIDSLIRVLQSIDPQLSPQKMELISTLVYSYRWVRARGKEAFSKAETIKKFKEIKKSKFSDQEIETAYDQLVAVSLVEE